MSKTLRPRAPYAETDMAKFLDRRIDSLRKISGSERVEEVMAKFISVLPKEVTRFRKGEAKFPLDRIYLLANATSDFPAHLLRMALEQHFPELQDALADLFGYIATPSEAWHLLRKWREATDNLDPDPTPECERAVDRMIEEVKSAMAAAHHTQSASKS